MRYVITYINITEEKCYHYVIVILNIDLELCGMHGRPRGALTCPWIFTVLWHIDLSSPIEGGPSLNLWKELT